MSSPVAASRAYLSGQWVHVASSWVAAVRWTAPLRLDVRTKKGQTLHYSGCTVAMFGGLLAAGSKGTFINVVLKQHLTHTGTT